jgi:membrane-bound lytic murein transglycosylase F
MGLSPQFVLFEPLAHRWAVRAESDQLHSALNTFIESEYRGVKYNLLHAKYFEQSEKEDALENKLVKVDSLSPYDEVTKHYSEKYGFDWRLVTALMFQESRFNPDANSYSGAKGVMQLTGATAKFMGLSDTKNVEKSINAGVRYLNYLRGKFDNSILLHDRMWFAVASYNSGYTRLKRARGLAVKMGLDKDKWFKNVELAMLLMAKPYKKNGKKIRNCRCGQTVVYVREIRTRYFNYIRLTETQQLAMRPKLNKRKYQVN